MSNTPQLPFDIGSEEAEKFVPKSPKLTKSKRVSSKPRTDDGETQQTQSEEGKILWGKCLDELRYVLPELEVKHWLEPLRASIQGDMLVLNALNRVYFSSGQKFLPQIETALQKIGGDVVKAEVKLLLTSPSNKKNKRALLTTPEENITIEESDAIEERFTFENFVKGKCNLMAYNACLEMARQAEVGGHVDAPLLFIYGASGLGKTHLMQAVAHRYKKAGLGYCYFTKDGFFRAMISAVRTGNNGVNVDELLDKISGMDLLIIDDIHLINTQNGRTVVDIFFNLCNQFTKGNKRLILASDKPPSRMQNFESRFLSRFSGGLSLCIDPPDMDTRVQIVQKKASTLSLELSKECVFFIARNISSDVRAVEGALNQIASKVRSEHKEADLTLIKEAIQDRMVVQPRMLTAEGIRDVVSSYFGVSVKDMLGKKRERKIARPRQFAMALIREMTVHSYPEIGQVFGGRDHTTVIHACDAIQKLRETDESVQKDYQALLTMLESR